MLRVPFCLWDFITLPCAPSSMHFLVEACHVSLELLLPRFLDFFNLWTQYVGVASASLSSPPVCLLFWNLLSLNQAQICSRGHKFGPPVGWISHLVQLLVALYQQFKVLDKQDYCTLCNSQGFILFKGLRRFGGSSHPNRAVRTP